MTSFDQFNPQGHKAKGQRKLYGEKPAKKNFAHPYIYLVALHAQFPRCTLNCLIWEGKGLEKCGRETQAANGITTPVCQEKKNHNKSLLNDSSEFCSYQCCVILCSAITSPVV